MGLAELGDEVSTSAASAADGESVHLLEATRATGSGCIGLGELSPTSLVKGAQDSEGSNAFTREFIDAHGWDVA